MVPETPNFAYIANLEKRVGLPITIVPGAIGAILGESEDRRHPAVFFIYAQGVVISCCCGRQSRVPAAAGTPSSDDGCNTDALAILLRWRPPFPPVVRATIFHFAVQ